MRFYYFVIMFVGIILVLNLGGVTTPTADAGSSLASALNLIDSNQTLTIQNVKNSELWSGTTPASSSHPLTGIKWILIVGLIGGFVVGLFGKSPDIRYLTAAFVFGIASLLLADLTFIFKLVIGLDSWIGYSLGIVIGGLIAGFIVTTLQFWQGTD